MHYYPIWRILFPKHEKHYIGACMSIASQSTHQKFPFPYDIVYDETLNVIPEVGLRLKEEDKMLGRIVANTGMSLFSWGENIVIIIEKQNEGTTIVGIESSLKLGINVAGAHRHQKNFNEIISALSKRLKKNTHLLKKEDDWKNRSFDNAIAILQSARDGSVEEMHSACERVARGLMQIKARHRPH